MPDLHCDDHDPRAVSLAIQLCQAFKPSRIIFLGDVIDAYWASSFPTDYSLVQGGVMRELAAWQEVRRHFKAPLVQRIPGNHEQRIQRNWAWLSPAFKGMESRIFGDLFDDPGYVSSGEIELAEGAFLVTHGDSVCKWAGLSAKAEMDAHGTSGASGHTHRLATYSHRNRCGVRSWTECGHLARNPPQYVTPDKRRIQNWQQGVVTLLTEGNQFHVETIPFTLHYRAMLGGRRYSA